MKNRAWSSCAFVITHSVQMGVLETHESVIDELIAESAKMCVKFGAIFVLELIHLLNK